jgi:hypothetical protein
MDEKKQNQQTPPRKKTAETSQSASDRQERLAAQLRANLKKRKLQTKKRASTSKSGHL